MKRFVIAVILLISAVCFAVYADYKTEAIFGNIKSELIELEKLADEKNLQATKLKANEINDVLSLQKKTLGILTDHSLTKQIEINIQKIHKENSFDEIKRNCTEAVTCCEIIMESFKAYLRNIF